MNELSQQEKNDIIATRICGWHSPEWMEHEWHGDKGYVVNKVRFNPCNSLDDCFLAEEKMIDSGKHLSVDRLWDRYYLKLLAECGDIHPNTVHATPMQKVNAMLKALETT